MNTGMIAAMILLSTVLSMAAGFMVSQQNWSWAWALLAANFFVTFFGVLMPFRFHYTRSRGYYRHW